MKEYSPFTPGVPVPLDFFVGRQSELEEIVSAVGKAVHHKTLEHIFVTGERGIGKSSLCNMAMTVAEERHATLGLHVYLGGVTALEELARRVLERLLQKSRDKSWYETIKKLPGQSRQAGRSVWNNPGVHRPGKRTDAFFGGFPYHVAEFAGQVTGREKRTGADPG